MVSFSIFSLLTWYPFYHFIFLHTIFQNSYSPSPSSSFFSIQSTFKITHASLFPLVHTGIYHHHTSMSSCPLPLTGKHPPSHPSVSLLPPHFPSAKNFHFLDILIFYILFLPFCIIKSILPYLFANLPYPTTDVLLPEFPIHFHNVYTTRTIMILWPPCVF